MKTTSISHTVQKIISAVHSGNFIEVADGGGMRSFVRGVATLGYKYGPFISKGASVVYVDNGDGTATTLRAIEPDRLVFISGSGAMAPYEIGEILPIDGTDLAAVRAKARERVLAKMREQGFSADEIALLSE